MREVREFLVRVFGQQDSVPSGCGFLVGSERQHIFTCCHVVNDALGRSDRTRPLEPLYVDFPFLAAKRHIRAEVFQWHYDPEDSLNDIAVLKLQEPAPNGARSATFVTSDDYSGDAFRAFGFPKGLYDADGREDNNGRDVNGTLGATQVNGRVLAKGISEFGYFIERGFSGTPIWNSTRNGVCGMAFQVDTPIDVKVASFIPTELLSKAAADIIKVHLQKRNDPEVERYLQTFIAELEKRRGVLQYADLSGSTQEDISWFDDEFGFSELVRKHKTADKDETKIPLGTIHDALNIHKKFVLIGDAGGSKTTTIRRLALETAKKRLADSDEPLPLLLSLHRWHDEITFEDFIRTQWTQEQLPASDNPIQLIQYGRVILYLDGLNEMGANGSNRAKDIKSWLQSANVHTHVIITCRKDDYTDDFDLNIPVVQIDPMNDKQIRGFAKKYLDMRSKEFLKRILPSDKKSREDLRHLLHLARNPYMLSALIFVFTNSSEQELPQNYGVLFDKLVRALAVREVKRNSLGWNSSDSIFSELKQSLANLAFSMIDQDRGIEVSIDFATDFLDENALKMAQSANYIEVNGSNLRFYHQLMQEYFASCKLDSNWVYFLLKDIKTFPVYRVPKWKNSIIAHAGLTDDISNLLEILYAHDIFLAVDCLTSGMNARKDTLKQTSVLLITYHAQILISYMCSWDVYEDELYYSWYDISPRLSQLAQIDEHAVLEALIQADKIVEDTIKRYQRQLVSHKTISDKLNEMLIKLDAKAEMQLLVMHILSTMKDSSAKVEMLIERLHNKSRAFWGETISNKAGEYLAKIKDPRAIEALQIWRANQK